MLIDCEGRARPLVVRTPVIWNDSVHYFPLIEVHSFPLIEMSTDREFRSVCDVAFVQVVASGCNGPTAPTSLASLASMSVTVDALSKRAYVFTFPAGPDTFTGAMRSKTVLFACERLGVVLTATVACDAGRGS